MYKMVIRFQGFNCRFLQLNDFGPLIGRMELIRDGTDAACFRGTDSNPLARSCFCS